MASAGFVNATAPSLKAEIRRLTAETEAVAERVREHGTFYTIPGQITGPTGIALSVKLVWLHRADGVYSFVTLVPLTS